MCIVLSLLSLEYTTSQQAGATSIPEETVPPNGRKRKMATCSACGHSGHTKASILCRLKGNRAPGSADPAATAVATAAATAEPPLEDYLSDLDEGSESDLIDSQLDPRYEEEENELYSDSSTSVDQSLEVNYTTQVVDLTHDDWSDEQVIPLHIRQTRQGEVVESADSDIPVFKGRIRGPTLPVGWAMDKKKPIDYFQLFITKDVTKQWISSTNSAGKNLARGRKWTDITFDEMLAFLALVVFSGVVKYAERGMPWESDPKYGNEWVKSTMSKVRFDSILTRWSYVDTTMISNVERASKNKDNCFWTVQKFLDSFAEHCRSYYKPYGRVNVDEGVFGFKGRHRARCYNPNKPEKWHFKSYCLNCSTTGFLMNVFMYQGKDEKVPNLCSPLP
jgi:hypothetical protein